jgi:uncharacterized surface protein with fasciclin (FAS1) repeats
MEEMDEMSLSTVNFGAACAAVPMDGEGSFDGMADDPAATAGSNNPVLSTLVTAVIEAELVDTLNGDGPFTIFAPYNDAFAAIPAEDLDAILADTGTVTTVNGAELTVATAGDTITVNGANVICGNVQTANGTVHIIDTVLVPAS